MEMLLRRDQKSSMMGNVTFILEVRARLTDEEQRNIVKYKLGKTVLYTRDVLVDPGKGLMGLAGRLAFKALNISVSVDDLSGRYAPCDIIPMRTLLHHSGGHDPVSS